MVRALLVLILVATTTTAWAQQLPAEVCKTVKSIRGSGPITSPGQLADMLNAMAWAHRADGWGVSTKRGGNRCPRFDGQDIACDILHHKPTNQLWDVFVAAGVGEPTNVTCSQMVGVGTDPNRPWLAPIEPQGGGGGTDPKDQEIAELKKKLAEADAALTSARGRITELEGALNACQARTGELEGQVATVTTERDEARQKLAECEAKPPAEVTCRASLHPGWVGRLGIRASCEIVK